MKRIVVTQFSGPLGYQLSRHFFGRDVAIDGIEQFLPRGFRQAPQGSARYQAWLDRQTPGALHFELDISNRDAIMDLVREIRPSAIVHSLPFPPLATPADFNEFALAGTRNLLDAAREFCWLSPFVFLSSNQVSGAHWKTVRMADQLVQGYGRNFSLPTCSLRGPIPTDPWNPDVALYDPLAALVQAGLQNEAYSTSSSGMAQQREAIHARDVAAFIELFLQQPRFGEAYNISAGAGNSYRLCDIVPMIEKKTGRAIQIELRAGTESIASKELWNDLPHIQDHYPAWIPQYSMSQIIDELVEAGASSRS